MYKKHHFCWQLYCLYMYLIFLFIMFIGYCLKELVYEKTMQNSPEARLTNRSFQNLLAGYNHQKTFTNRHNVHGEMYSIQHYVITFFRDLWVWCFSPGTPVSSTIKSDRHDIIEILLKVALNTINLKQYSNSWFQRFKQILLWVCIEK